MKAQDNAHHHNLAITADCVLFGFNGTELRLLLVKREKDPFKNKWALPGGFVFKHETAEVCAKRVLSEKVGIKNVYIEQLYTFTDIDRDPRERTISIAHYALVNQLQFALTAGRDTIGAEWFSLSDLPKLAFDHLKIVSTAINRLKSKVNYQPIGFELLNEKFTLPQLQVLYEAILDTQIDKRNFRKKILAMNLLVAQEEKEKNVSHKAARYYKFDSKAYKQLSQKGFHFEI